jgi:FXSXX-COOH protein
MSKAQPHREADAIPGSMALGSQKVVSMRMDDGEERYETFSSEVIDLKDVDLSAVGELSSAVLRSAIGRICHELSSSAGASASFQSCLRGMAFLGGSHAPPVNLDAPETGDDDHEQCGKPELPALSIESGLIMRSAGLLLITDR